MELQDVEKLAQQYMAVKAEADFIAERQNELKSRLKDAVEKLGEVTAKGHKYLEFGDIKLTNQRKESTPLDVDVATEILNKHDLYSQCVKTVEHLDQNAILVAYQKDLLTAEELELMFPKKVSYAFLVQ
jgi:predicted  nucleic acid-binding Zn-ribbon protein